MNYAHELFFVRILIPFLAGIWIFYQYPSQFNQSVLGILSVGLLLILILINLFYTRLFHFRLKSINGQLIICFLFVAGGWICINNNQLIDSGYFGNKQFDVIKVRIANEPQLYGKVLRFKGIAVKGFKKGKIFSVKGKMSVAYKVPELYTQNLSYGDEVLIPGNIEPVEPPYNPGEFNFKNWLATQNIYHQTFAGEDKLIIVARGKGNPILASAFSIRQRAVKIYRRFLKNDDAYAIASALVLGYRANLDKETLSAFTKTGTIHALSVSGAHVAIIFFFLNHLLSFLGKSRVLKIIRLILICSILWGYALLTGFSPSVIRAVIMLTVFVLAKAFSRSTNSYNILAFSAFCMLIFDPFYLFDTGFQLSFLAVFGLLYLQPLIYKMLFVSNFVLDKLWQFSALSISAQMATLPLSIYYFHQFPVYFLAGNLFIMLPVNLIMAFGAIILIPGMSFLGHWFEIIMDFTQEGLKWISQIPGSSISGIYINKTELVLVSVALALFISAIEYKRSAALLTSISLFLVFGIHLAADKIKASRQELVIIFTVRNHYASLFIDKRKAYLVTDLKPGDKEYLSVIQPALELFKIKELIGCPIDAQISLKDFKLLDHQLMFKKFRMLIIDKSMEDKMIHDFPRFTAILVQNNPKINLVTLRQVINSTHIIADGTNRAYILKKIMEDGNKLGFTSHTLNKNPAYLIYLK